MKELNVVAIQRRCNMVWVSQNVAVKIVEPSFLEKMVNEGVIRANKRDTNKQNSRWDYNLWDLLKVCDMRRNIRSDVKIQY